MSRFVEGVRRADRRQSAAQSDWAREPRPFQVVTVTSNKGGVGKTTVAGNLAVYFRALCEELPVLMLGFDDQRVLDQMFAIGAEPPEATLDDALRAGDLGGAIRMGQYGVHYVPSSDDLFDLKRAIDDPFHLQQVLLETGWEGLVVIDTKSDLEILTQNAIAASDLALVLVADQPSLREADRVFDLLKQWNRPRESARVLLSMVDLRIKYGADKSRDVLGLLVSEIRRRGHPLFQSFLSRSPRVASLCTNPEEQIRSILHGAEGSVVRLQMQQLAEDVLRNLEKLAGPLPLPSFESERAAAPGPPRDAAIPIGSLVRIADREVLEQALRGSAAHPPEPAQFAHAGATARAVRVLVGADGERLYGLDRCPGLWRESWLRPLTP
jgi:cellulose biosynthesis protein BcsQ